MEYYPLTLKDKSFADKTAQNINKDYPGEAIVIDGCCLVTKKYWLAAKKYVQSHSKIKHTEASSNYHEEKYVDIDSDSLT